jgi:hypothetical protein
MRIVLPPGAVRWENNAAERGLRPLVMARTVRFGCRSEAGADRRCALRTMAVTARLRGESFLAFAGAELGLPHPEALPGS